MDISFNKFSKKIALGHRSPWPYSIPEVPILGEWTTIDIINEELEPGKCTLTVLFGGRQVFKEEKAGTLDLNTATVNYHVNMMDGCMDMSEIAGNSMSNSYKCQIIRLFQ